MTTATRPAATPPAETQRRTRGHVFYPPKVVRTKTPEIRATEAVPAAEKVVHAHYFTGGWDWYVVEADWGTGEAFGLVKSPMCPDGEWGSFDLREMEAIRPRGSASGSALSLSWVVERDCYWTKKKVSGL